MFRAYCFYGETESYEKALWIIKQTYNKYYSLKVCFELVEYKLVCFNECFYSLQLLLAV